MEEELATAIITTLLRDCNKFSQSSAWVTSIMWYLETLINYWSESQALSFVEFMREFTEPGYGRIPVI